MVKTRKVYKTILGIPIWMITGLSIFLIVSIIYDLWVGDRNTIRYITLSGASLILLISVGINLIPIRTVRRIASRQFGG